MSKINLGSQIVNYPMPVAIAGATVNGKHNFMTVAWLTMANYNPPKMTIVLGKRHFTNQGIKENRVFSVCFPSIAMIEKTDYAGLISGANTDKSKMFTVFYGKSKAAPLIEECPLCVECELDKVVDNESNEMFIGFITGVYTEEQYLTDKRIDFKKINPLLLSQTNTEYWTVGEKVGRAWSVGKSVK